MINPNVTFERFLSTFVPGALLTFGSFYLHRPFFLRYFPYVAGDPLLESGEVFSAEWRTILFSVIAICVGVVINQLSDTVIAAVVDGEDRSGKTGRIHHRVARLVVSFFSFRRIPDVRRHIMERYLASPRSSRFLDLLRGWCFTDDIELGQAGEPALAHQHLVARLRSLSDRSNQALREAYMPLSLAAALFLASVLLWFSAALAPLSALIVKFERQVHPAWIYLCLWGVAYIFAGISAYNLRRRIRIFYSQVVTLALHFYCEDAKERTTV